MATRPSGPTNRLKYEHLDLAGQRGPVQLVNITGLSTIGSGSGAASIGFITVLSEAKEDITQAGMNQYYLNAFGVSPVNGTIVVVRSANFSEPTTRDLSLWEYQNGWTYIAFAEQETIETPA